MQNAAEYERFEAEEALLKIQHEESKKNKQKIVIDPKANDKNLENYLYGLVQDIFPSTEFMEWDVKDPKKPPESTATITKCSHQELWSCVMRHLNRKKSKTKAFSEDSLSFARQVSIVLLKVNSIIP